MKTVGAVLEYVGNFPSEMKGDYVALSLRFGLPDGKDFMVEFKKSKNFRESVPMVVTYIDEISKQKRVFHENYVKFLIDNYGQKAPNPANRLLKFVSEIKEEVFAENPLGIEIPSEPQAKEVKKEKKKNEEPSA